MYLPGQSTQSFLHTTESSFKTSNLSFSTQNLPVATYIILRIKIILLTLAYKAPADLVLAYSLNSSVPLSLSLYLPIYLSISLSVFIHPSLPPCLPSLPLITPQSLGPPFPPFHTQLCPCAVPLHQLFPPTGTVFSLFFLRLTLNIQI